MNAEPVNNWEVFLWAVYEVGGADQFVDVEHAFLRAFEIAPQRFAWRTRPDIPDKLKLNPALHGADVRSPKLLLKNGTDHRRLTAEGQAWIEDNFDRLAESLGGDRIIEPPKARKSSRLLSNAKRYDVFKTWTELQTLPKEKWKFADMLRCSPDSSTGIWTSRLSNLRSAAYAADDKTFLKFLDDISSTHSDWFGE